MSKNSLKMRLNAYLNADLKSDLKKSKVTADVNNCKVATSSNNIINTNSRELDIINNIRTRELEIDGFVLKMAYDDFVLTHDEYMYAAYRYRKLYLENRLFKAVKDLWPQIVFSIVNARENKRYESFKHSINLFYKVIKSGMWKIPFGFKKYTKIGVNAAAHLAKKLAEHAARKAQEIKDSTAYLSLRENFLGQKQIKSRVSEPEKPKIPESPPDRVKFEGGFKDAYLKFCGRLAV